MDPDELVRLRLRAQMLRGPAAASPEDSLRNLLAVQAQEFPYARWSLAQRTSSATAADVEQAVADGRILRTHILRPTWHFVHRDDLRWLMALSAPRLHRGNAGMYRRTGIDAAAAFRGGQAMAEAVRGGRHLTREQLAATLQDAGFEAKGLELVYLIMHAEITGVLASGSPVRSAGGALKQTYALFEERVPAGPAVPMTRAEALAELVRRYFTSRGPATIKDCADWSGLTMADVRQGLQHALDADPAVLATAVIDGVGFYFGPGMDAGDPTGQARPRIDLVQCYDEYVMGYSATRHYLGGRAPALPVADAPIHVVLLDGRMIGSWRHTLLPGRCEVDVRLSASAEPLNAAVESAVARYAAFLGMPAVRVQPGAKLEAHI
ncbi:AlkZ family DNA glycosylase [Arthrobacter sp. ISL-48]|nr:AlkZ family DNA glycosylase [Arthrobacter sp. ISL-48]